MEKTSRIERLAEEILALLSRKVGRDLETYIKSRSGAEFSHGVCPVCYEQAMGKME